MKFDGKVALITGGGGGIGRATAVGFAERGAKVFIVDNDADSVQATVGVVRQGGGDAQCIQADVTTAAETNKYVQACLAAYGRIDCFFNNAGIEGKMNPMPDYEEDAFDRVMAVNVKGVFLGMKYVLPTMLAQGSGTIVNTASTAALFGTSGMIAYIGSKHAVLGMTKSAAIDVARKGIRINAVCPGPVETRMMRSIESMRNPNDPKAAYAMGANATADGRYATPEEIANAVLYLSSDLSGHMLGQHVVVDGGRGAGGGAVPLR
jgi:NAD(P)-dependent dehydrogenase (short-subunit alcohol dehydrogenase family)